MAEVYIVTDSTSDVPQGEAEALGITVIPLRVVFSNQTYRSGVDMPNEEFYRRLVASQSLPSTSQPPPGEFEEVYRSLLAKSPDSQIIGIFLSSLVSGTYNTAKLIAEQVDPQRIHVIDSQTYTMAYGIVVLRAAQQAREGRPVEEILANVNDMLARSRLYAMINTMTYLIKGGRVSRLRGWLGSLLSVKPIIEANEGRLSQLEQPRTTSKAIQRIIDLTRAAAPLEDLTILHTTSPDLAAQVRDALADIHPTDQPIRIVEAGSVIGTHAGPGCIGTAFIKAK